MNTLNIIIFSKNRAMQLELLLRSLKDNFHYPIRKIFILYTYTDEEYKTGYDIIKKMYQKPNWILQNKNFKNDMDSILNQIESKYLLCLSDDCVVIRSVVLDKLLKLYTSDVIVISMRTAKYITESYGASFKLGTAKFIENNNYLKWKWIDEDQRGDWGYPHGIDSNIYRTEIFKTIVLNGNYKNPPTIETLLQRYKDRNKPYMVSDIQSLIISVPVNTVRADGGCKHGDNPKYTTKALNKEFLNKLRISTGNVYNINNEYIHQLINFEFKKFDG